MKKLFREFKLEREHIDEEARTVSLAFSSEEPYQRIHGLEILDHGPESIRLDRLKNTGAVLVNHDVNDQVGVVENINVADRRGRAVVRFGKGQRATEIFNDVLDGIRRSVSVGYVVHKQEKVDSKSYRVTDWEPLEVSIVSIPADSSVGVGRSDEIEIKEEIKMETKTEIKTPPVEKAPEVNIDEVRSDARKAELERIRTISAIGEKMDQRDLARQFVDNGGDVEKFRAAILDAIGEVKPVKDTDTDIGLTHKEVRSFSFLRAINALRDPNNRRAQEDAAFERECSEAVAQKRGSQARGIFVPDEHQVWGYNWGNQRRGIASLTVPSDVLRRDLNAGTATDGAELVATNLLTGSFIDVLRNALVVARAGATMLTGLSGDVAIPRKTSGSAGGWISTEGGNAAQSDPQFDQVTLTPKTAGTYTEITRQLLLQSSMDVENLVRSDLAIGLATLIDLGSLYGDGASGAPTGVSQTNGINAPTDFAAANPTFAEVVDMETQVDVDNALMNALGYILRADMKGALKTTEKASSTAQFVYENDQMNGYPAYVTQQVTSGDLFYGNWADLLIGMWGGLDLLVDPYSNSLSGTVRVVAHQSVDVAVRHPVSFSFNNDGA